LEFLADTIRPVVLTEQFWHKVSIHFV
jgi:hypothetical protein